MKTYATGNKTGGALFSVMIFVLILSTVVGTIMSASSFRTRMISRVRNRMQAEAYAEAGANYAYSVLITNWSVRTNFSGYSGVAYGEGTFGVGIVPVGDLQAKITSTGLCYGARSVVIMDAMNYGDGTSEEWEEKWWESEAFEFAMLAGSSFDFGGCGNVDTTNGVTKIHSNQALLLRGASSLGDLDLSSSVSISANNHKCDVAGDGYAPAFNGFEPCAGNGADIDNAYEQVVPLVTIPNINLTPWQNEALKGENGTDHPSSGDNYINTDLNVSGGTYIYTNPTVWWIEGDVTISAGAKLSNVSIIATGTVTFNNNGGYYYPPENQFSLVSINSDISIASQSTIDSPGLMYTKNGGDYNHTGGGHVDGQFMISGDINDAGNSGTTIYNMIIPMPPGWTEWPDDTPGEDIIGVSAWQD